MFHVGYFAVCRSNRLHLAHADQSVKQHLCLLWCYLSESGTCLSVTHPEVHPRGPRKPVQPVDFTTIVACCGEFTRTISKVRAMQFTIWRMKPRYTISLDNTVDGHIAAIMLAVACGNKVVHFTLGIGTCCTHKISFMHWDNNIAKLYSCR